ncbi:hypothetical protein N7478_004414 [Penicillium angulare]|uniref:uncharacterized protein n=1 Tax=Penicillium angulare TaxID=116970 RepID=UPI0025415BEE|nr:uncharacterized protein N7478_004414 [Penicillium angulare]KAJ5279042.1 hypothetical protein N7478_004414 [Penicillium angulare]
MVSTRHHPKEFPSPTRAAKELVKSSPAPTTNGNSRKWVHTPSVALTLWLVFSVPLVIWDAGYVLLRPHSMPGGRLHSPLWTPYALYGRIDYIYGWPAFNARNGFTAAQTALNVVETLGYLYYLWIVYRHGATVASGRGAQKQQKGFLWLLTGDKVVAGRTGAIALMVAYTASVMTLSKTILYLVCGLYSQHTASTPSEQRSWLRWNKLPPVVAWDAPRPHSRKPNLEKRLVKVVDGINDL